MASLDIHAGEASRVRAATSAAPEAACPAAAGGELLMVLPRFGAGGASKVTVVLASALADQGLGVTLATYGPAEGVTRRWLDPAVEVLSLSRSRGAGRGAGALVMALPALAARLRRAPPSVLMSAGNHANVATALAHALAGRRRPALVLKLTNPIVRPQRSAWRRALKAWVYRVLIARADAVLALSPEDAAQAAALCPAAAGRIRVVDNPYLPDERATATLPSDAGEPTILAVGRLTAQKNHDLLLSALARLRERPWRLEVLGAGAEQTRLEARARALGLGERVSFLGYVPDPSPHYAAARVLAISSRWEALPAVAIEALAAGCRVVTTDCSPALSRLVGGSGQGDVTPSCDIAFAEALARALEAPRSAGRPACVDAYTLGRATRSHLDALEPLLAAKQKPRRPGERRGF